MSVSPSSPLPSSSDSRRRIRRARRAPKVRYERSFSRAGVHPYDELRWENRIAAITSDSGKVIFEQRDVEVPSGWSQLATNVVVSKYFRGAVGHAGREHSVKQLVSRVVDTITGWGRDLGYFASESDVEAFSSDLCHLLVNQYLAFNSPVWFNVGIEKKPQCSACQPYHARVMTVNGPMPIGDLVERRLVGLPVYDGEGLTQVVAVKHNGRREVFRIELSDGRVVEATADHLVCAHESRRKERIEWRRVDQLRTGMVMRVYPHAAETVTPPGSPREIAEAALAGWLQGDGFCGQYEEGTNRSLTAEFLTNGDEEHSWVLAHLETALPGVHSHVRDVETQTPGHRVRRIRLYGEPLRPFVEKFRLLERGTAIRVPAEVMNGSDDAVAAYLKSVFQAEGYVTIHGESAHVALAVISPDWVRDLQVLLSRVGVYSRIRRKEEKREDRFDTWELDVSIRSERIQFADRIGFLSERKAAKLRESLALEGKECPEIRYAEIVSIRSVGETDVFDIQTRSGQYLSEDVLVHNCFINSVEDTLESILELAKTEGMLFKYGSGAGSNLSKLRSSREMLSTGGKPSGPVSFMRGYDAFANVIKSGGKTRRAAKMQILDCDHPDVEEFIWCKAHEEKKAHALIDAGYDGSVNGEAYQSVFFQNSNLSVRVTDDFMRAVEADGMWTLLPRTAKGASSQVRARDLYRQICEAAWKCGDPGVQYDDTINRWHTCKGTDRIYASNPCSEYMFLDDTACNLASLNLLKFRNEDGSFDEKSFRAACRTSIIAQEIIVDSASYPTPRIGEMSHRFRTLGLGYANLGALLMAEGLPYDSDAGRAYAAAVTALMTGEGYRTSAELSAAMGPFPGFAENEDAMLGVIAMHRDAAYALPRGSVPDTLLAAARGAWDEALDLGREHGYRNAQTTVLAPTGTIAFMMDCDTTGVEPDIALVKYKKLVGGGVLKIVNRTVPLALEKLGYTPAQIAEIIDHIDRTETIEGAPGLKDEHLPVFDCAFRARNGIRSIAAAGHVRMMAATQPFLSGAISKTVNLPPDATVEEIGRIYMEGWKLGLKAIAIYRDGCKRIQPLSTSKEEKAQSQKIPSREIPSREMAVAEAPKPVDAVKPSETLVPRRRRLPDERRAITHKFSIGGHDGYITIGEYDDGAPGEIFVVMAKEGSTVSGLMDSVATLTSIALQYGVPADVLVNKFSHTRFEPSGMTTHADIRFAKSPVDYIFRYMGLKYVKPKDSFEDAPVSVSPGSASPGPASPGAAAPGAAAPGAVEDAANGGSNGGNGHGNGNGGGAQAQAPAVAARSLGAAALQPVNRLAKLEERVFNQQSDAPSCHNCGGIMTRNGSCYKCGNCGETSGCS